MPCETVMEVIDLLVNRLANGMLSKTIDADTISADGVDVINDGGGLGAVGISVVDSDGRNGKANGRSAVGSIASGVGLSRLGLLIILLGILGSLGLAALFLELRKKGANLLAKRRLWRRLDVSLKFIWMVAHPRVVDRSPRAVGTKLVIRRDRGRYQAGLLLGEGPVSRRNCGKIAGSREREGQCGNLEVVDVAVGVELLALARGLLEDAAELVVRPDQDAAHVAAGKDLTPLESAVEPQALRVVLGQLLLVPADQTVKLDHVDLAALVEGRHGAKPRMLHAPLGVVVLQVKTELTEHVLVLLVILVILLALEGGELEEAVLLRAGEWDVRTG